MRIINTVLGDATGGRWQVVIDYNELLHELGHTPVLVAERDQISTQTRLPLHGELQTLHNRGHYDFWASWQAHRLVKKFKPDLIIAHCSRSIAVFKRAVRGKIPVIGVSHSNNIKRMAKADAFFNISTHIAAETQRLGGEGKPGFLIPNKGAFPEDIQFAEREWRTPPVIGAIGRFDPVKGFHILIKALGLLAARGEEFKLRIAGGGIQEDELKALADEQGISQFIDWSGWTDNPRSFIESVDLLCVPALSDAFGLTPLDAAAYSTPMVLSEAKGHQDMFCHGESALYAEVGSPESLAAQLQQALNQPQQMQQLARQAHRRVMTQYTHARLKERLAKALEALSRHSF